MSTTKDLKNQEFKTVQESKDAERAITPAVDIYENEAGITVLADMPGVSRDRLDVQVDNDSLSISGKVDITVPQAMDALYADIRATRYQRSFALSRELDGENIDARLKDGVLTLHIPKREEHKPRKIEIHTG